MYAAQEGATYVCEYLVETGADINIVDKVSLTFTNFS